jgi:hypothetical protein
MLKVCQVHEFPDSEPQLRFQLPEGGLDGVASSGQNDTEVGGLEMTLIVQT